MGYTVPASKIVFTDFMTLLVSVLMGLNSVMYFEEQEARLPPVKLPKAAQANAPKGETQVKKAIVTVRQENEGLAYFYNDARVTLEELSVCIKRSSSTGVILRGDRETPFAWETFCNLTAALRDAGVKEIQYAVTPKGGNRP